MIEIGADPEDPRLAYPGSNPTDAQLDPFAGLALEYAKAMLYNELIDLIFCRNIGYLSGISLTHTTCGIENGSLLITGKYEPSSEYFKKDESTFPYITYTYDFRGSLLKGSKGKERFRELVYVWNGILHKHCLPTPSPCLRTIPINILVNRIIRPYPS